MSSWFHQITASGQKMPEFTGPLRVGDMCAWGLVRKGGLEPPWIAPPDPKSGASANSATLATHSTRLL